MAGRLHADKGPLVSPQQLLGCFGLQLQAKARTKGTKSSLQLHLPYLASLPLVLPEKLPPFLPGWRRLRLVPSSKSTRRSREHPEGLVRRQPCLPGRAPAPPAAKQGHSSCWACRSAAVRAEQLPAQHHPATSPSAVWHKSGENHSKKQARQQHQSPAPQKERAVTHTAPSVF